jgi:hypothetical protein
MRRSLSSDLELQNNKSTQCLVASIFHDSRKSPTATTDARERETQEESPVLIAIAKCNASANMQLVATMNLGIGREAILI